MAETEDNGVDSGDGGDGGGGGGGGTIGEWRALISSPKGSLFSGFLADGYAKSDDFLVSSARKSDEGNEFSGVGEGLDAMMDISSSNWKPQPSGSGRNGNGGGSIAERRAARCGFNAQRLNTARFRSTTSPLSSPSIRSPYLTIPPGLSPTSLLDSPVMLPNSQAQPSPTTGTFRMPSQCLEVNPISETSNPDKDDDAVVDSPFMFKPHGDPMPLQCLSGTENQVSNQCRNVEISETDRQILSPMETQGDYKCQAGLPKQTMSGNYVASSPSIVEGANNMIVDSTCISTQMSNTSAASEHALQHEEQVHVEDAASQMRLESGDNRGAYPVATGRPSEDGYNWRKYGQKQVKGSEYPRSYYKCTHQNCQVKKKIERSHDGQITEIIYKGGHNHPQPQPSRRSGMGSAYPVNEMLETGEGAGSYVKVEGGSAWRSIPHGSKDNKVNSDWRGDGQERTSSASVVTEVSDPLSTAQGKHLGIPESADTPELSSTLASHDEEDDRATQGSISLGDDADDDESESKRRKKDNCLIETNMASRAVREPRVVVQTDSEVDILDDGYRWRKYGQKVVKGNPNPRSYYKCTSAGCSVRKHVERASHDLKYVITTYEGKHNHEVPAARNSSHMNSNAGNIPPTTTNSQPMLTLPRHTNMAKTETQNQDLMPHFDRKLSQEFYRPNSFNGFMPSSYYEMKLPPLQNSLASYGIHQGTHIPQVVPDFSMPMNVPLNPNLGGLGFGSLGKSFIEQSKDGEMKFLTPKQEQRDDNTLYESQQLPNGSSAMYRQMMGGFPL